MRRQLIEWSQQRYKNIDKWDRLASHCVVCEVKDIDCLCPTGCCADEQQLRSQSLEQDLSGPLTGWNDIKPTGAFGSVFRPTNTLTYVDMFTSSPCRLQRTSRVSVKTSCKNSSGVKTLGNCVLAVISGTFWTMLNHCDLDFLSIFRQIWTYVCRSGGSMKLSVQTGKQSTYVLIWSYFIFPFCFPNVWIHVNEGYLICGILHWELLCVGFYHFLKVGTHFKFCFVLDTVF